MQLPSQSGLPAASLPSHPDPPQGEQRFWAWFALLLGLLAALKGLRLPGTWVWTQSLLDYSHGFVKRGLLGAIYGELGITTRLPLSIAYFVELATLMALLALFTHRSTLSRRLGSGEAAALFAGSYALTYLFHLVGYSDLVDAALLLALLLVRGARPRFLLALPAVIAGLLIHEAFLLLFLPVLLLSFLLQGWAQPASRRRIWTYGLILTAIALALTLYTSLRTPMGGEQVDDFATYIWNRADFEVREDFFQVLTSSLGGNLAMMQHWAWGSWRWWEFQAISACVLGPPLALLLHFSRRLSSHAPHPRLAWLAALVCSLSPLSMHLLALDQVRWNTWTVLDAYLVLGVLAMHLPGPRLPLSLPERRALLVVLALGMASGYGLFNGAQVNPYPFFPRLVQGWIDNHDAALPGFVSPANSH